MVPITFFKFLSKRFWQQFALVFTIILSVIILTTAVDLLNSSKVVNIPFADLIKLIFYKVPYLSQELLKYILLISTLLFYDNLSRSNELIIIKNSGLSIWQIISVCLTQSLIISVLTLGILNPIGSMLLTKQEKLEKAYFNKQSNLVSISAQGLILIEPTEIGKRVTITSNFNEENLYFSNLSFIEIDKDGNFKERIKANAGKLDHKQWELHDTKFYSLAKETQHKPRYFLPTTLTFQDLLDNFVTAETIPVFDYPEFLERAKSLGLPIKEHLFYFSKILMLPLILVATILIASCFITFNPRSNQNFKILSTGLIIGIITNFLLELIGSMLLSYGFEPILSMMVPTLIIILVSTYAIVHFYEVF